VWQGPPRAIQTAKPLTLAPQVTGTMAKTSPAVIVLAAGLGTRMKTDIPKVLHPVAGRPMLLAVLDEVARLKPARTVVVVGPDMDDVAAVAKSHPTRPKFAVQKSRRGTGDAVKAALPTLGRFSGDVVVTYGDSPLITAARYRAMLRARRRKADPAVVLLGFRPYEPEGYGRLIFDDAGALAGIVEYLDLKNEDDDIAALCNGGAMVIDGKRLAGLLAKVRPNNAKKEYYLTDLVGLARKAGHACDYVEADPEEPLGVNSRLDLAVVESLVQERLRARAMENGATLTDPTTVYFNYDTKLGRDVVIGPNVVFGAGVTVGDNVTIRAFCHIDGARIADGAIVGPFARLRPGADVGEDAHVGNFVEIKAAALGAGAKANHHSYIGDARVGAGANIGAGTITCNYDGVAKHLTDIGAGAFIGSNTALVAPVKVGDRAVVGAGSVITRNVAADALAVTRPEQVEKKGWARAKGRAVAKRRKSVAGKKSQRGKK
jgi:bifunctional UDP-N-acetylglucosamine pyrophosphorylase/glucosamine-1-phosphate N-acetyltransferase